MRSARSFWRSPPNDVGRAGVGHAHVAGTGESGSISFSALRSAQQAAGMLAFSDATFSVTSLARAARESPKQRSGAQGLAHGLDAANPRLHLRRGLAVIVVGAGARSGHQNS